MRCMEMQSSVYRATTVEKIRTAATMYMYVDKSGTDITVLSINRDI